MPQESTVLRLEVVKGLRDLSLRVALTLPPGVTTLIGPSGAGKTTVLRLIAGLMHPDRGTITLGDAVLDDAARRYHLPPGRRSISLVFQEYALFPHLSVGDNVAYGLRAQRVPRQERQRRVAAMLERLGLATLSGERPGRLSGGQRQRVALARALVLEPRVLLLDEPLGALDTQTRAAVRGELRAVLADLTIPTLLVTHDYADALAFRDRIVVLESGQVVQDGPHSALLAHPHSRFVADFIGVNYYQGMLDRPSPTGTLSVHLAPEITVYVATDVVQSGPVTVIIPPWEIVLSRRPPEGSARNVFAGQVREVLPLGGRVRVALAVGAAKLPLVAEITPDAQLSLSISEGQTLYASFKATAVVVASA